MDLLQASLSCRSSSIAPSPGTPFQPTNDDIEAVIQMATSARATPDGRTVPPRDTRTQLFVGNLPYRVRWQDLKDLFRRAGTVLRADVSLGPDNRSRGYGTVLLATAEEAGRAVDMFNGYSWQTRILEVRPDRLPQDMDKPLGNASGTAVAGLPPLPLPVQGPIPLHFQKRSDDLEYASLFNLYEPTGSPSSSSRSLFVGNLPFHCQWQDLKDLFRQAGTIIRADVALGPDGRSRGFGTVIFAIEADAERAVKMFNGYEYNGRALKVHFDKFMQLGQGAASAPVQIQTPSLASMTVNNMGESSSILRMPYLAQISQIEQRAGYQTNCSPPSRSSSPSERSMPISQRQHQFLSQGFHAPTPSVPADIAAVTQSLGSFRLHSDTMTANAALVMENIPHEVTSASTSRSASRAPSSSSSHENRGTNERNPLPGSHHQHPHHPGPITLPPLPASVPFPFALHKISLQNEPTSAQTPIFNNSQVIGQQQITPVTPHGLPPITPSMPPFTFLPPRLSPQQYPSPPHTLSDTLRSRAYSPELLIPSQVPSPLEHPSPPLYHGLGGFSPGTAMSPGAFWGRPGNPNPHINPAVGAPVHGPHPSSPGHYVHPMTSPNRLLWRGEPTGYFDPEYFPRDTSHPSYVSSSLANEILKENSDSRFREPQDGNSVESQDGIAKLDDDHSQDHLKPSSGMWTGISRERPWSAQNKNEEQISEVSPSRPITTSPSSYRPPSRDSAHSVRQEGLCRSSSALP